MPPDAKLPQQAAQDFDCGVGLVLDEKTAAEIVSGKRQFLPMHYQCRSVQKGAWVAILTSTSAMESKKKPAAGHVTMYLAVGLVEFVGNRRFTDQRMLEAARAGYSGLPVNEMELQELRKHLSGLTKKQQIPAWEFASARRFSPFLVAPDSVRFGSACGMQDRLAVIEITSRLQLTKSR